MDSIHVQSTLEQIFDKRGALKKIQVMFLIPLLSVELSDLITLT